MFKGFLKYLIFITVCTFNVQLKSQINGGSFEEWYSDENFEIPAFWDAISWTKPKSVSKSFVSSNGFFSVKISTYDKFGLDYIPVYIATKFKPESFEYQINFDYIIDSIDIAGKGAIRILQKSFNGSFEELVQKKLTVISSNFISDSISFSLNSLDTIMILIGAESQETPTSFEGFASLLFDNVYLSAKTSSIPNLELACFTYRFGDNQIVLNNLCEIFTYFKVFSNDGKLLLQSSIINNEIPLIHKGFLIVYLFNNTGPTKYIKIINP